MFGVVVAIAALLSWNTPVQADAPAAPTDLSARNWWGIVERNSDEGITLSWTAPEGTVTGYRILRQRSGCDDALVVHVEDTESDATTYTDRDVVGGVTYEYRVKAINSDDVGSQSDAVTFEYAGNFLAELGDDSGPDRPTGLEVWNLTSGIQLKWRAPDGTLTGYQILRRSPGNCEAFQVHAENTGNTSAFWDDPDVEVETPYEYRVVAINRFGRGGQSTSAEITRSTTTGIRVIYSPEERYTLQRRTNWIQMGVNHRLALDDDPETIDYTFRGDVTLSSDGSDVDSCEGTGLGEGREIRQVSRRSQTFDFTFGGAGCRIGTYSITHVFYDSEDNELFSVIRSEEVIGVAINGRAQVGETLSTDVSTLSDTDDFAGTTFKYKWWTSDDSVIQGATSSTYTVVASNVGKAIWAEVEVTDIYDRRYVIQSLRTAAVVPANSAASGAPTNGGTAQVGQTLNVDTSSIADEDGLDNVSYSYQWLADDANIRGATGPTYTLVAADVRKAIKSRVSFTDDAGNQESITSDPTEEVPGIWGGTVTVGSDPAGSGAVGYSAFAIGMGSITAPDFVADGEGYTVDVVAYSHQGLHLALSRELSTPFTLHLDARTFESSSASTSVGAEAYIYTWDHPGLNWTEGDSVSVIIMEGKTASPQGTSTNSPATGTPTISGSVQVGQTLTVDTSKVADQDGSDNATFAYQWARIEGTTDTDIQGGTGSTYTLTSDDEGKTVKVRVTFTDDAGNSESLTSAATAAVEEGEMIPLTATIPDAPSSHDGSNTFTFELRFSEEFPLSYRTLRDHAFTVTGGEVVKVRRLEKGRNVRWEISVRPDGNGAVTIVLPATTDCEADGAVCTDDGRKLSQELEFEVPGLSTPEISLSTPEITSGSSFSVDEGATQVATLRATDGDTPAANLTWSISGGDDAAKFAVTAAGVLSFAAAKDYETPDDAGADGVYEVTVQVSDGGRTDSADLTVTLTNVNEAPTAEAGANQENVAQGDTVTLNGSGTDPDAGEVFSFAWVQTSGATVTLSDTAAALPTFTAPTGQTSAAELIFTLRVTDDEGLFAEDSVTVAISGQLPLTPPVTATTHDVPSAHDGSTTFTFEVRFSEEPAAGFSYKTLRDNAFTVTGGEVVKARRLEKGKNVRWEISVRPDGNGPVTIVLPATTDCDADGAVCTDDGRMLSNRLEITVPGPGG